MKISDNCLKNLKFSKAFTLIEILIVVLIIGVISAAIWKFFSYRDVDRMNFDSCYIKTYWSIDSFFQQALSQKWVYTWWDYKVPVYYNLVFDKDNQKLELQYSGLNVVKTIDFFWTGIDDKNKCFSPTFHTFLSWNISKVQIKPWLQVDNSVSSDAAMVLYSWDNKLPSTSTWEVIFSYCTSVSNANCLQKYRLIVDPRTYMFKSYFCVKVDLDNWKCLKWSQ